MKFFRIIFIPAILILLVACGQADTDRALPTLADLPTAGGNIESQSDTDANGELATEWPLETDSETVASDATAESELEVSPTEVITYALSDFANPTLWRIVSSATVNAYACASLDCEIVSSFSDGDLIRVIATAEGWHAILTLDGLLVYIQQEYAVFVQIIEVPTPPEEILQAGIDETGGDQNVAGGDATATVISVNPGFPGNNPLPGNPYPGFTGRPGNQGPPTAAFSYTQTPLPTFTSNPFFTPVLTPGNPPPGVVINPTSSGPIGGESPPLTSTSITILSTSGPPPNSSPPPGALPPGVYPTSVPVIPTASFTPSLTPVPVITQTATPTVTLTPTATATATATATP